MMLGLVVWPERKGSAVLSEEVVAMRSLMLLGALVAACAASAGTIFVDAGNCPGGDGASWATAKCDIQSAIDAAAAGDDVYVKAGVYRESITLRDGVSVYGGFEGTELTAAERDIPANETAIDVSSLPQPVRGVTALNLGGARLDGFLVRGGRHDMGVGLYAADLGPDVVVSNCRFEHNAVQGTGVFSRGGGVFLERAPILLEGCTFKYNSARQGGGLAVYASSLVTVRGCTFESNSADFFVGGGGISSTADISIEQCRFIACYGRSGAAIEATGDSTFIKDSVFIGNGDPYRNNGAAVAVQSNDVVIERCFFAHNLGGYSGVISLNTDRARIYDSVVVKNLGTGIQISDSSSSLFAEVYDISQCTIADNTGDGLVVSGRLWFRVFNSIFANNMGSAILQNDGVPGGVVNCLFSGNLIDYVVNYEPLGPDAINTEVYGAEGNFAGLPGFRNASALDYRLLAVSAAIGAAHATYTSYTDVGGNERPGDDGTYDIGAYDSGDTVDPAVLAVTREDASPTGASFVRFCVTFSEPVEGVDPGDFQIDTSNAKAVGGAEILGVTGTGASYVVSVSTGSGDGALRLRLLDDNSIVDGTENLLGGIGLGDGDFLLGEVYVVDRTAPVISLLGDAEVSLGIGTEYSEAGATALDSLDGDLSGAIAVDGVPNTNVPGTYAVTYTVSDAAGNVGTATRTVVVLPEPDFVVTPGRQFIGSAAATVTFDVINRTATPATWSATVVTGAAWCAITSGASGNGTLGAITVQCAANTTATERTATIQVTDGTKAALPITVEIVQAAAITAERKPGAFFACSGDGRSGGGLGSGDWMLVLLLVAGLAVRRGAGASTR